MLVVKTTFAKRKEAERAAEALVRERLAACASVYPCKSFFFWEGKLWRQQEFVLELKTAEGNFGKLEKRIRELSTYSLPQIVAFSAAASRDYAAWLEEQQAH